MSVNDFEAVCDAFERECQQGKCSDIREWLHRVPPEHRERLQVELVALESYYKRDGHIDGLNGKETSADKIRNPLQSTEPKTEKYGVPISSSETAESDERLTLTFQFLSRKRAEPTADFRLPTSPSRPASANMGLLLQNRYRIVEELGQGGFGIVYLAEDVRLRRKVAVKMMLPRRIQTKSDVAALEKLFTEEAQVAASLHHSAIANIFDIGLHADLPYMVFEYVAGESLRDRMRRHPRWTIDEIRRFVLPVSEALDYAHRLRVVHRDLKPENIRITVNGEYKILDLGLARRFDAEGDWCFAGTPAYASPEQAAELPSDGRIDQYALSVILYEMLAGVRPFLSKNPYELLDMHRKVQPPHPRTIVPTVSESVAQTVLRGLSKDPTKRFASCSELAAALGCAVADRAFEVDQNEFLLESTVTIRSRLIVGLVRGNLILTAKVLWMSMNDAVREIPIDSIKSCRTLWGGRTLEISYAIPESKSKKLTIDFPGSLSCQVWQQRIAEMMLPDAEAVANLLSRPVPVISTAGDTRYQVLGHFRVEGASVEECVRKSQIRGAMVDADAILNEDALAEQRNRERQGSSTFADDRLERIDAFRKMVFWPFQLLFSPVRWVAKLAGGDESQRARVHFGSFVAVRACHEDERRELMTTHLRKEIRTAGNWLLVAVAFAIAIGYFPNFSLAYSNAWAIAVTTTYAVDANAFAGIGRFVSKLPVGMSSVLLGSWPLIMALAIRFRKSALLAEPGGVTFIVWSIVGYFRMMNSRLNGYTLDSNFNYQLFFACVLLWLGVVVYRIGRRFTKVIRYTDPNLVKFRYAKFAWLATLVFALLMSGIFDWMFMYLARS